MLSTPRALALPCFAGCGSGRMAISDLRPLIFCALLTISPVMARDWDLERVFLPQAARNRKTIVAPVAKIRTAPREFKFKRPVAARHASAWLLSSRLRARPVKFRWLSSRRDHPGKRWGARQAARGPPAPEDRQSKDALRRWAAHLRRECPRSEEHTSELQ